MPIKFINDKPPRFQHLGRIRLGHKEKSAKGTEYPKADPFFVLDDVSELRNIVGEQPTTIAIEFLFDDLELTFPHYLRRYSRAGLLCLGDGEHVIYQKEVSGKTTRETVRNMHALDAEGRPIWDGEHQEHARRVECTGENCPYYQNGECKPTGYLRFLVKGAERQGYYDLVCHQRATIGILSQLQMAVGFFGRLTGIPWLLHRGDEEQVEVPTKDGPKPFKVRTQWIEIEPQWFQEHVGKRREMLLEEKRQQRLLVADTLALWDEAEGGPTSGPSITAVNEFARNNWPGERETQGEDDPNYLAEVIFDDDETADGEAEDTAVEYYVDEYGECQVSTDVPGPSPEIQAAFHEFCDEVREAIPAFNESADDEIKAELAGYGWTGFSRSTAEAAFGTLQLAANDKDEVAK